LEGVFRDAGTEVVGPVRTVADALALPLNTFDAAVLDLELEDGSISPFALKLWDADTPFVFATGYGRDRLPRELKSVPCLEKPVSSQTLVDSLIARTAMLGRPPAVGSAPCDERKLFAEGRPTSRRQGLSYTTASLWQGLRTTGRR
jgi:hypothetical protein